MESDTRCVEGRSGSSHRRSGPIKRHALFALTLALAPISISAIAHAGEPSDALVAKTFGVSGVTHAKSSSRYSKNFNDIDYGSAAGKTLLTVRLGTPQEYDLCKQTAQADAESIAGVAVDAFRYKTLKAVCAPGTRPRQPVSLRTTHSASRRSRPSS